MLKTLSRSIRIRSIGFGGSLTPSTRYRLLQFIDYFSMMGVKVDFSPSTEFRNIFKFLKYIYGKNSDTDAIWIQKKLFPAWWIWIIARDFPIVFDFDDAIWTSQKNSRSRITQWRAKWKLYYTLKKSSLVVAGNNFLASYASKYASRVVVVPTVINVDFYPLKIHEHKTTLTLGWIGYSGNFIYLKKLQDVLTNLSQKINFKLLVIADVDFQMQCVNVENRRWSLETEIQDILDMDIGLMPLENSEWALGKCAFKAIQYMASGIPAVASDVGSNSELITSGENGFLTNTNEDWIRSITILSEDFHVRQKMGLAARNVISEKYALDKTSEELLNIFHTVNRI